MTEQPGWQQPYPYGQPPVPPRRNRTGLFVVLGVVAVAVVAGVVALVVVLASDDVEISEFPQPPAVSPEEQRLADTRDGALEAGEEIAEVFNTLDYQTVAADLDNWESHATGDLLTQVKDNRDDATQAITQGKTTSVGTVLSAAVSELDVKKRTATVLAAVKVEVTQAGGEPTEKRIRLLLTLEKTSEGWRANNLSQVPAG